MIDHATEVDQPNARERLEGIMARAVCGVPGEWVRRLSGASPVTVDGRTLDHHVQLLLTARARKGTPGLCEPTPAAGRARYRREITSMIKTPTPVGRVDELTVPGGDGAALRARHYAPAGPSEEPRPLLVYFHGGGFVIGDLDTHDEPCRLLCHLANTHVLSVAYRLAPEFPFPCAVDDSIASLRWALEKAATLGADPSLVSAGGDSAGGNLAAVASLALAEDGFRIAAQLLIYPTTDSLAATSSRTKFGSGYMLERRDTDQFGAYYLRETPDAARDPRVNPSYATNLSLSPSTLIVTAGFDPLRDEGMAYAELLRSHGVVVRVHCEDSLVHGFIHLTTAVPRASQAMTAISKHWAELARRAT